ATIQLETVRSRCSAFAIAFAYRNRLTKPGSGNECQPASFDFPSGLLRGPLFGLLRLEMKRNSRQVVVVWNLSVRGRTTKVRKADPTGMYRAAGRRVDYRLRQAT